MADFWDRQLRRTGNVAMDVVTLGGHSAANRQSNAAEAAGRLQSEAADNATNLINQRYQQAAQGYQPYQQAGQYGLNSLMDFVRSGEAFSQPKVQFSDFYKSQAPAPFQQGTFNYQATPGYQYQLDQSIKAAQNSAAAKGALQGSNTINKIQQTAQGLAAQDYGNEFNRFMQQEAQRQDVYNNAVSQDNLNRSFGYNQYRDAYKDVLDNLNNKYSTLGNLANMGMSTQDKLANMSTDEADKLAELMLQRANVQGSTVMGKAQARANMLPDAVNRWSTLADIASKGAALFGGGK